MRIKLAIFLAISMQIAMASTAVEIIFKDDAARTLTKADTQHASGNVYWENRRGTLTPDEAQKLQELGRSAGARGEIKAAIEDFEKAAKVAPGWTFPLYDVAYTYLLSGDFAKAYAWYKRVDDRSPRCKTIEAHHSPGQAFLQL